jgi:multiple sugar transport system substrate-binding protein
MSLDGSIDRSGSGRLTRRRLLISSATGLGAVAVASLLSACGGQSQPAAAPTQPAGAAAGKPAAPGGFSGGGSLKLLVQSHFVPAYDTWFDKWAADWGAKNKVEIQADHILSAQLAAKIAAEVASTAGHDIYRLSRSGEPQLFNKQMVDVSDISNALGSAYGGWIPLGEQVGLVDGVWRAVPEYFIDFPALYRKDIFDDLGLKPVDTWDDLLKAGTILKDKGFPIGIAINQQSNDASNSWNCLLWSFGSSTVGQDGKTITIDSPETRDALKFAIELYNKTMTNEVLSWDDTGNNLLLAGGKGSWIQNPISALRTIEKENPELAKKILISNPPAGPKGRHAQVSVNSWGIANWASSVPAAKAFLTDYYQVLLDGVKASEGYNQPVLKNFRKKPMPILGEDPRMTQLQDFDQYAHATGWPGTPTPSAGEVETNWIVPLMVGRAVQDGDVNGAVEWAAGRVKAIYAKA